MTELLPTSQIHNMNYNYRKFCDYAGITFVEDADHTKGTTGVTFYDNPVIKGAIRWSYTMYGDLVTLFSRGVPDFENSLHRKILDGHFNLSEEYEDRRITQYDFEEWLNDELLKLSK